MKCTSVWCVRSVSALAVLSVVLAISALVPATPASGQYICGSTPMARPDCTDGCGGPGRSNPGCPHDWQCFVTKHSYVELAETHLNQRTGTYVSEYEECLVWNCPSFCN